jgi:uncharacterized RDD family membrane protein YckC
MQEEWYVELAGAPSGPHERLVVTQMRQAGRITPACLVWRTGFADWVRYADAGLEEQAVPPRPAPLPPPQPNRLPLTTEADALPDFELASSDAPLIQADLDHQNAMRHAMTQRNVARGHASVIDDLPVRAPRLEVEDDGWQWTGPAPWRRYLARTLDMFLLGSFTWMVISILLAVMSKDLFETFFTRGGLMSFQVLASAVVMASLIPVQAILVGTSGTTIGKWIFGVRVTRRDGSAIGIRAALAREASVLGIGMACGVPLVAFIPIFIAYQVLTQTGTTQWDRGKDWVVTYREPGDGQSAMFILGVLLLVAMGNAVKYFEAMPR